MISPTLFAIALVALGAAVLTNGILAYRRRPGAWADFDDFTNDRGVAEDGEGRIVGGGVFVVVGALLLVVLALKGLL